MAWASSWGCGTISPRSQGSSVSARRRAPRRKSRSVRVSAVSSRANRLLHLRQHRPRVHPLVDEHYGHARGRLALQDRRRHRRGASVAREQGWVDVQGPQRRHTQQCRREKPAVRGDDQRLGRHDGDLTHSLLRSPGGRLENREAQLLCRPLHRRRSPLPSSARGPVRLGRHTRHIVTAVQKRLQNGDSEPWCAKKEYPHSSRIISRVSHCPPAIARGSQNGFSAPNQQGPAPLHAMVNYTASRHGVSLIHQEYLHSVADK